MAMVFGPSAEAVRVGTLILPPGYLRVPPAPAAAPAVGDPDGPHVPLPDKLAPQRVVPPFPAAAYGAMLRAPVWEPIAFGHAPQPPPPPPPQPMPDLQDPALLADRRRVLEQAMARSGRLSTIFTDDNSYRSDKLGLR